MGFKLIRVKEVTTDIPESGYLGQDSATLLVEIGGFKVKMVYTFKVATAVDYKNEEVLCPKPYWKISSTLDANGNSTITSVEYLSPTLSSAGTFVTAATLDFLGTSNNPFFGMKRKEPHSE